MRDRDTYNSSLLGHPTNTHSRVRLSVSRLIIVCRDTQKGQHARKDILWHAPVGAAPLFEVWKVYMAVKSSVVAFAERATSELDRVDAVLLNAGIDTNVFEMADGDESTLTVNVISPFLLALVPSATRVAYLPKHSTTTFHVSSA